MDKLFSMEGPYARFMNWLWNILVLSLLWLLCSLPVLTLGASSTAAYYGAAKVLRHKNGTLVREFFASFRRNLRQSIPLTLVFLLLAVVLGLESLYLYSDSQVPLVMVALFAAMLLAVVGWGAYLWACLSRFDRRNAELFRLSVVLTFRHLLTTIGLLALVILVLLGVFWTAWGILLFPGCGFYLATYLLEPILRRYSPRVEEDDPEAQKWYYQ